MSTIEETIGLIRVKCEEVKTQVEFINSRAGIADAIWKKYDVNFVSLRAVLKAAAQELIVKAQELETLIP